MPDQARTLVEAAGVAIAGMLGFFKLRTFMIASLEKTVKEQGIKIEEQQEDLLRYGKRIKLLENDEAEFEEYRKTCEQERKEMKSQIQLLKSEQKELRARLDEVDTQTEINIIG